VMGQHGHFKNPSLPAGAPGRATALVTAPCHFRRRGLSSWGVKSPRPSFADQGGDSLPQTHQWSELPDKRIAAVLQVEFEPLGRKYGRTCRRPARPSCKRHGGVLEQEDSANPPVDVRGNPKAFLVAADEKCRNCLIDD